MDFRAIYVVRKRALGDVLWIEPIIRMLASSNKKVVVHSKHNLLFRNYPLSNVSFKESLSFLEKVVIRLSNLIAPNNRRWISLDNYYERFPKMHILHAYEQRIKINPTIEYPKLYVSDDEAVFGTEIADGMPLVVLHINDQDVKNYRKVFGVDFNEVCSWLANAGFKVVQIGLKNAGIKNAEYHKTSLRELVGLLSKAKIFIGPDSGPSHMATALQVPSLLFFGAVNPLLRHFPEISSITILQGKCQYAGCFHEYERSDEAVCKIVGDKGVPPCCLHQTADVILALQQLKSSQ